MRRFLVVLCLLLPGLTHAAEPKLPYAGATDTLPVQVVLQFLGKVLGEHGQLDYRYLKILQDSQPPFDKVNVTVIREGVNDAVLRGIRHRFILQREGAVWSILAVEEDFSCRNRPVWGTKPCQ